MPDRYSVDIRMPDDTHDVLDWIGYCAPIIRELKRTGGSVTCLQVGSSIPTVTLIVTGESAAVRKFLDERREARELIYRVLAPTDTGPIDTDYVPSDDASPGEAAFDDNVIPLGDSSEFC